MVNKLKTANICKEMPQSNIPNESEAIPNDKLNTKSKNENNSGTSNINKTLIHRAIGAKIAYYRTLRQLSQRELANKVHISTSTLGRIERGKYNNGVSIATLLDIAEGLRVELSTLLTFSEEEKKIGEEMDKNII